MCHVLIAPSWYPGSAVDAGGSFFREQAAALLKNGCRVGVVAPQLRSVREWKSLRAGRYGVEITEDEGIPTVRWHGVRWFPRSPYLNGLYWVHVGLRLYNTYVERYGRPDVVHAHSALYGGVLARAIRERDGIPYVVTEHHTAYARGLIGRTERRIALNAVSGASRRLAVSESFSKVLQEYFGTAAGDWEVLSNLVSDRFVKLRPSTVRPQRSEYVFLCIALLSPKKAVDNLLAAFASAFKGRQSVALRIGGDGPERARLVELADRLGIAEQVTFLGPLTRDEVAREMSDADAFVLPSRFETFGVVVIEALALGKPVIATRCGGPECIVRAQDGILVAVDDVPSLAQAMCQMLGAGSRYDPMEIQSSCIARFGEEAITARLKKMYHEVLYPAEVGLN